jgi:hypothetical protein
MNAERLVRNLRRGAERKQRRSGTTWRFRGKAIAKIPIRPMRSCLNADNPFARTRRVLPVLNPIRPLCARLIPRSRVLASAVTQNPVRTNYVEPLRAPSHRMQNRPANQTGTLNPTDRSDAPPHTGSRPAFKRNGLRFGIGWLLLSWFRLTSHGCNGIVTLVMTTLSPHPHANGRALP